MVLRILTHGIVFVVVLLTTRDTYMTLWYVAVAMVIPLVVTGYIILVALSVALHLVASARIGIELHEESHKMTADLLGVSYRDMGWVSTARGRARRVRYDNSDLSRIKIVCISLSPLLLAGVSIGLWRGCWQAVMAAEWPVAVALFLACITTGKYSIPSVGDIEDCVAGIPVLSALPSLVDQAHNRWQTTGLVTSTLWVVLLAGVGFLL